MKKDSERPDGNLKPAWPQAFPRGCKTCGKVFADLDAFVAATGNAPGISGLFEVQDTAGKSIVGMFRNCSCGTRIMILCKDRRDDSEFSKTRRVYFEELVMALQEAGHPEEVARADLRKILSEKQGELIGVILQEERSRKRGQKKLR